MKWEENFIKDICQINPENISRNYPFDYIKYLDITSVGSGIINEFKDIQIMNAPSRAKRIVRKDDSIIATVRPGNKSYYFFKNASNNFIVSTGFAVLRPKIEKVEPRFLYYTISQPNFIAYLVSHEQGANYPAVTPDVIGNKIIELPTLPIQQKIVSILSAYDDLIENNLNRIKLLEESAETFYKFYFDFFNPSIKDNNLPKGWFVKLADEIFDIKIGKTPPREQNQWFNQADDGVKWISVKDINNTSVFILNTSETLSQESLNKFNINIVKEYTVILSFKLTVGKVAITTGDMVTNEAIAHFNIIDNTFMNTEYIYFYLKLFPYDILGSTSSIGNAINSKVVKSMPILVPDKNTINKFQKIVRPFFSQIKNLIIQNNILREARDILLPKLMYNESDLLKNI